LSRHIKWFYAVLSGLLMALSSAPFDQWYLSYIAFVPLIIAFKDVSPTKQGLAYALSCTVIASNWWHSTIIYSIFFFLLIVSLLCLAFFLWGYLSAALKKSKNNIYITLFSPAVIWVGIERILSSEIVGIPCNIGITQTSQPLLIQSASFFGIYAVSFLIILTNTAIAMLILSFRSENIKQKKSRLAAFSALGIFAANFIYGLYIVPTETNIQNPVKVAIIQPVITTNMYLNGWRSPETRAYIKNTLDDLTSEAVKIKPDILVWPEGGNGYFNMRIDALRDSLYKTAITHKTDLLISSNDIDGDGKKYNSIFSISKEGRLLGRYNKVNLIPGAEDSYTAGTEFHTIPSSLGEIGPVICYESNFPSPFRKATDKGAELLFVSTSDAAFKKTSLTINHTRTAIFRAIENNRWVVHASNTGPSVIVSPFGLIAAESQLFEKGFISGDIEYIKEKAFFTKAGYLVPILFAFIVIALTAVYMYRGRKKIIEIKGRISIFNEQVSMGSLDVERTIKYWFGRFVLIIMPLTILHSLFLVSLMTASIMLVYARATPESPAHYAIKEFFTPLDTMAVDKVTEKFLQAKLNTCGPAVLAYVFSYFGKDVVEADIEKQLEMTDKGTSLLELKKNAIKNNFHAKGVKENYAALLNESLPVIAYINDDHYVVVNKITKDKVYLFDPAIGHVLIDRKVFERKWNGYLLLIRTQPIVESYNEVTLN